MVKPQEYRPRGRERSPFGGGGGGRRRSPHGGGYARSRSEKSHSPPRRRSASISPTPLDRTKLSKYKIILQNLNSGNTGSSLSSSKSIFNLGSKGSCLEAALRSAEKGIRYGDAEFKPPSGRDLSKIQIEIRRNIPAHRISTSPVRRSLRNPSETVHIVRRPDEGRRGIFDRDEIKHWASQFPERRVVALLKSDSDGGRNRERERERSRSPLQGRLYCDNNQRSSRKVKDRLGSFKAEPGDGGSFGSAKQRGEDFKCNDDERVLSREELNRRRPAATVNTWEHNPQFVPQTGYFFEHDNREGDSGAFGGGFRSRFQRSGGTGRFQNRGGRFSRSSWRDRDNGGERFDAPFRRYAPRTSSPESWKHDKFEEVCDP